MNAFRLMRDMIKLELINSKPMMYKDTIFGLLEDFIIDEIEPSFL